MKILIMHLSDIHLRTEGNIILGRKEKICQVLNDPNFDAYKCFVVVSGDIAYSGKQGEYYQAMDLLGEIQDGFPSSFTTKPSFIMIPGNHDCDYEVENKEVRKYIIEHIQQDGSETIPKKVIEECCKTQNSFFQLSQLYEDESNLECPDRLLRIYNYELEDFRITFYCYNTSWMSQLEECYGGMMFPLYHYPDEYFNSESDLIVSVLHHPFFWQDSIHWRDFRDHIEKTSDIILTGHEHIASKSTKDDLEGSLTTYFEGAILQEQDSDEKSGFNLVVVDLNGKKQKIYQYRWNGEIYSSDDHSELWCSYRVSKRKNMFVIGEKFGRQLNDIGAGFTHPNRAELTLQDLFVYPDLRDLNKQAEGKYFQRPILNSEVLRELDESENRILLLGDEKSGKTSLCRVLYRDYYNKGYTPVYINGYDITQSSTGKFSRLIEKLYKQQYSGDTLERFNQLDKEKKVLIIDDFDKSRLNAVGKYNLLSRMSKYYPNVIITANSLFQIEEVMSEQNEIVFDSYQQYGIMQFGNVLRAELISKWNVLGEKDYVEKHELMRKNDNAKQIMDMIIGNNFIPSYPIFLLTILQTIELGRPHDLQESAYGHYYQCLITQAISKVIRGDEVDSYYQYITDLANHLFEKETRELSRDEFADFHKRYCDEYRVSSSFQKLYDFDELINNLLKSSIIEENNGIYRFRYKYIYYYFIARYMSNNITEGHIKQRISEMCKRLYMEESANIIMFLTHHSKNPIVLDNILEIAKSLFSEIEPLKFEKDISGINKLLDEVPRIVLEDIDVEKSREIALKSKDEVQLSNEEDQNVDDEIYSQGAAAIEVEELDVVSRLNLAFKLIEILGQVLRNYCGSLKGTVRMDLGEEAYSLGLRAVNSFFSVLEEDTEYFVNKVKSMIEERSSEKTRAISRDKIERFARGWLFHLCALFSYCFIKKISDSIGYEKLSETLKDILKNNDFVSFHLIDISIKLDFFRNFPYKDIEKLCRTISGNLLPHALLRIMAVDYLYMFPVSDKNKQRICNRLGIPISVQRRINITSTQKKK